MEFPSSYWISFCLLGKRIWEDVLCFQQSEEGISVTYQENQTSLTCWQSTWEEFKIDMKPVYMNYLPVVITYEENSTETRHVSSKLKGNADGCLACWSGPRTFYFVFLYFTKCKVNLIGWRSLTFPRWPLFTFCHTSLSHTKPQRSPFSFSVSQKLVRKSQRVWSSEEVKTRWQVLKEAGYKFDWWFKVLHWANEKNLFHFFWNTDRFPGIKCSCCFLKGGGWPITYVITNMAC